jgi:DNA-binding MarR family transcriptional regulator
MPQRKSPRRAQDLRRLREAILDLSAVINSPKPDAALIAAAGVELDRALFPLLSRIERGGSLGVKELAASVGRDYTTVSRQVSKLETLGLVSRESHPGDGRISKAALTAEGRKMATAVDRARKSQLEPLLAQWSDTDFDHLLRLTRRLADDLTVWMKDPQRVSRLGRRG